MLDARDSYGPVSTRITRAQRRSLASQRGRYEVLLQGGVGHIRDTISGELMHSVNDPAEEAHSLYVQQSRVTQRLRGAEQGPLVIWDVGLGAAANAMATILAVERMLPAERARGLRLVSFENDLDSLILALAHTKWFKHLQHAAPRQLLAEHQWRSDKADLDWALLAGDYTVRKFEAPRPDIIFFDPFSFKTDSALWSLAAFRELANVCADKATELFTYSYSTSVRAAMLAAGFYVAKGRPTGPKAETTIALSPLAAIADHDHELLGSEWLGKWRRSDARAPFGADAGDSSWQEAISVHPQFRDPGR